MPVTSKSLEKDYTVTIRITEACTRCRKCVKSCPAIILVISRDSSAVEVTDPSKCFECRACEVICPVRAIEVN
ncbi:MAG: ferredoxin family protein [Candidatus Odinarchaeota archaeon]